MVGLLAPAIVLFILASLFKISFIYNVSYVMFAVYVLARFWSNRSLKDLRCGQRFTERALIGDTVDVTLDIENRGLLPAPWLQINERLPVALIVPPFFQALLSLEPHGKRQFTFQLTCRQRGWYEIGPLTVTLGDVFGLTTRRYEFQISRRLTVYPKILALDELGFPSKSPFGHLRSRQPLYEDPARVVGVREYQSGDSLRRVNWKASASSGTLQVRKLEPAMTLETVILLNVNLPEYDRQFAYYSAELAIVVAASLASHLASLRQEVGVLTNGVDPAETDAKAADRLTGFMPRKGRDQLTSVLELLGRLNLAHQRPFLPLLRNEIQRLRWGATLIIVTTRESDELLETVLPLRRSGFDVVLIYTDYSDPVGFESAQQRARLLGMRAFRIWREADLDVWRRQSAATSASEARRAG
jgi:uncharacterized protein (DUF58 family)